MLDRFEIAGQIASSCSAILGRPGKVFTPSPVYSVRPELVSGSSDDGISRLVIPTGFSIERNGRSDLNLTKMDFTVMYADLIKDRQNIERQICQEIDILMDAWLKGGGPLCESQDILCVRAITLSGAEGGYSVDASMEGILMGGFQLDFIY